MGSRTAWTEGIDEQGRVTVRRNRRVETKRKKTPPYKSPNAVLDVGIVGHDLNNAIWELEGLSGIQKAVALAIAHHKNQNTGQCNPSIERLAKVSGFSDSTIKRALVVLKARGIIRIKSGGLRGDYRIPSTYVFFPIGLSDLQEESIPVGHSDLSPVGHSDLSPVGHSDLPTESEQKYKQKRKIIFQGEDKGNEDATPNGVAGPAVRQPDRSLSELCQEERKRNSYDAYLEQEKGSL